MDANRRPMHWGELVTIETDGQTQKIMSPVCSDLPRLVDLRVELWTNLPRYVTCPACRRLMKQRGLL
jgi:hypothetical protein